MRFGKHMQVAYTWTGVEFWLAQDGAGGLELTGNAFQAKEKDSGTANSFNVACDVTWVWHVP